MFSALSFASPLTSSAVEENDYRTEMEQEIIDEIESKFKITHQNQPVLILIGGFQGSGKSSLISRIKRAYDTRVISTDSIRQSLLNRGIQISPEFSKQVSSLYEALVKNSLKSNSPIIIDANSHSRRIADMEKLLKESGAHYLTLKIFLSASEATLRDRVRNRPSIPGFYQGTESDLDAALSCTKIEPEDYDLIVDTDELNQDDVFDLVNGFISPHLKIQ